MDVCLWDSSQRIASFATIQSSNVEELGRKYLLPLWMVPGDDLQPGPKKKEVVIESRPTKKIKIKPKKAKIGRRTEIESLSRRLDQVSITDLENQMDSIEARLQTSSSTQTLDKGGLETLQSRLSENIDRIEILAKRLAELEKRIKKISG
jgi:chromosome segregation ATPase